MAPANGQIVIDPFFVSTSLLQATPGNPASTLSSIVINSSNAQRQLSASAAGTFTLDTEVSGSGLIVDAGGSGTGSADVILDYLGFSLNLGSNVFFEFQVDKVLGTPTLGLILTNSSLNTSLSAGAQLPATNSGYSIFIDLQSLSGFSPAFLNGVDEIQVLIGAANQDFFVEGQLIQFSAVPEPHTAALVLLGGAWAFTRRRRRSMRPPDSAE